MKEVVLSPYALSCPIPVKESDSLFCGASSVPGSETLKYIPLIPKSHKYGLKPDCGKAFMIPIVWKGEQKGTELYRNLSRKLMALPLIKGSKVVYMSSSQGYFFDLKLEGGVRMTVTQYEDEADKGVYVNVMIDAEVLVQDFMPIDDVVSAMKEYYYGGEC